MVNRLNTLLHGWGRRPAAWLQESDEPIRNELFSVERLEQHAETLAAAQRVSPRPGAGRPLAARLRDNAKVLLMQYRAIGTAIRERHAITPAAEWLVDNFHIVEEQIREIHDDLPRSFYHQLPKLADGPLQGFPRVFGLAWAFVAHTDSRYEPETLCRFVRAYQRVQPLTIGELWAVAITLRIVLVENLRRSAELISESRDAREAADTLAEHLLGLDGSDDEARRIALRPYEKAPLPRAFAVQLAQRLRDHDPEVTPALRWLDVRLAAQGTTADELVRLELQRQGAMNVTVRNIITSMRLMSSVEWADFFESVSLVDDALRAASDFAAMDFPTRDLYRHAIEDLARGSGRTELDVVQAAIHAARDAAGKGTAGDTTGRRRDPGFCLVAGGRRDFEKALGFRTPLRDRPARLLAATGIRGYAAAITAITAVVLALPLLVLSLFESRSAILLVLALFASIPATDVALAVVNRWLTRLLGAKGMPGLELRDGVPRSLRTLVVVPTLLTTRADIEQQIERLEVHHLACAEGDLRFALLSDWTDSAAEAVSGDEELLAAAVAGIADLNRRHEPAPDGDRFLLLHRRRAWNESERRWMGWERKRGKLHELNRLLRGATDTTFVAVGNRPLTVPCGVRYVITLDADTRLPMGAARRLVGKMAHPLNQPRLDPDTQRVVEGHAVLQPRVTPALPTGREGSLFQRVFAGDCGIDPYAFAVSDAYQDLLDEGSYTGKGIYDVDAFEAALAGRIPPNTLLSHDLLEGTFARAGLVSDIEVIEEFPARYDVAAARQHRWARGDWQLLPWIIGFGRNGSTQSATRALPLIGRWKMLDNLRRTLSAPALVLSLVAGWLLLAPAAAAVWTACLVALHAFPPLLPAIAAILPRRRGISKRSHARAVTRDLTLALSQIALQLTFAAHHAWLMADAISRTLFRLGVSRRRLLEWVTAAQTKSFRALDYRGYGRSMAGGLGVALVAAIAVGCAAPGNWLVAAPFVALWMASPVLAHWVSRPPPMRGPSSTSPEDAVALRLVARRTWRFFETFVTAESHFLPPDNFQEEPNPVVAHRTSPTNLGLYLLSIVSARDFGWLGTFAAVDRLQETLESMERLERIRGHFLNWYDTRTLSPLEPVYVSSVDSGNLAGHLLALRNACREMAVAPVLHRRWRDGIDDALRLARKSLRALVDDRRTQTVTRKQLDEAINALEVALRSTPATPTATAERLTQLVALGDTVVDIAQTLTDERRAAGIDVDVLAWARAARAAIRSHAQDVERLLPWAFPEFARAVAETADGHADENAPLRCCLESLPSLGELSERCTEAIMALARQRVAIAALGDAGGERLARIDALMDAFERSARTAEELERRLATLVGLTGNMFEAMDFGFLVDPSRHLLSIGYLVGEGRLDPNCYDLLASEARLASFVAIAKGDAPPRHWFRLGRALTPVDRGSALISWSGSMFEYLMPSLVMRAPAGSLLEQTSRFVVRRQMSYGAELGVPWGVSESAYNTRDLEFTYQYLSFGVPGLGLKRGLSADAVIAPYATALAAMVEPHAATLNFARLNAAGACGRYGFYEALDYTPIRLPEGESVAIVRAYMAHHQGMTIVALANTLHDGAMRARFHAEPIIQATELLLQERTPRGVAVARPRAEEVKAAADVRDTVVPLLRHYYSPASAVPRTHLLSNGTYAVMLTAAGSGYSRWNDIAVTRWREDVTCDSWGTYIFLRDVGSGDVWSAGYQPTGVEPDSYEVEFAEDRAEFIRRDGTLVTTLDVAVSPEDDAEVRRVSIANLGLGTRVIELTSYAELVLVPPAADTAHPAFSKLFVQTEYFSEGRALLATRRRRAPAEREVWAAHLAVVEGDTVGEIQFETDRSQFLGRGRDARAPISVIDGRPLSNSVGPVLDPVFSLRHRLRIPARTTVRVAFWTLVAASRSAVLDLVDKHHDAAAYDRAVTLAWTQARVQLHHLGVGPDEAHLFQRLANHVLYSDPGLRPSSGMLGRNTAGPSALWPHGISGDLPILLIRIDAAEELAIVRQLLRAHEYWRMKLLAVDLVILNERSASYVQELQTSLETLVRASQSRPRPAGEAGRGRVHVVRADLVSVEVRSLLQSVARAVLVSRRGSLAEQLVRLDDAAVPAPRRPAAAAPAAEDTAREAGAPSGDAPAPPQLEFFNGLGGFANEGREYVTVLGEGQWTPAPWVNVIANPSFGFQISAEGGGYTWAGNSRENQLTPWSNDPVGDRPGEVFYVRDEDDGSLWCPTALPIRSEGDTSTCRHGQGYSVFEHTTHGIALELRQYVPLDDPLKISRLTIENHSGRTRRLTVTAYAEWVLGTSRAAAAPFVATEIDAETGALLATNPWRNEFGGRVAFADLAGRQVAWTADRSEFLGRNGRLARPAALARGVSLSNRVGAGFDPCAALQAQVTLRPNAVTEIVFFLGEAATKTEAVALLRRYRATDLDEVLHAVNRHWDDVLGAVQVQTPDRSLDILLNRWLLYQTLACRVWARSAFYQASGAYGFRDQLQDVMALTLVRPELTRAHLLRAAARQFVEGDVQHWWLPNLGQGVRTRVGDDRIWLPYVVAHYIQTTGDSSVLGEMVPFLDGQRLGEDEHESFFQPMVADEHATLFEHCARALDLSLAVGSHGLPLFGGGDWNDGMNRVGEGGKGESVWLGWFLHAALSGFAPLADGRGAAERAAHWRSCAAALAQSLEREAWDGDWYRRGFFDDQTPLGSAASSECRIDSIAQSWAVISGAALPARAARAMAAVDEHLVRRGDGVMPLFTPPFDKTPLDPGYIKGYPPGIRENGGQYTHAAIWSVIAFAMLGDGDKAAELFSMLNPIHHSRTRAAVHRYKVEPYVVAADVYSEPPHVGRGGWTWYTGSSAWMYRAGLESILGFRVHGSSLRMAPCIPRGWRSFAIVFRYRSARYEISVDNPHGVCRGVARIDLDGVELQDSAAGIPLVDDGETHRVRVTLRVRD
jgi:cyclic beta-1,2-glucan synthetase